MLVSQVFHALGFLKINRSKNYCFLDTIHRSVECFLTLVCTNCLLRFASNKAHRSLDSQIIYRAVVKPKLVVENRQPVELIKRAKGVLTLQLGTAWVISVFILYNRWCVLQVGESAGNIRTLEVLIGKIDHLASLAQLRIDRRYSKYKISRAFRVFEALTICNNYKLGNIRKC